MAGTPDHTVNGKPLTPEEFEVWKGRPGDAIPGGQGSLINDVNATGSQRVLDLRSGKTKSKNPPPPSAPPESNKAQKKVDAKRPNSPVSAAGGASKRTRASKGATAAKAKSVLSNNPSDNKLG